MAAVDILAAFGYKWAETGTVEALDDAQYKAGWAFIGATPPSVEQFNKVHQIADEKANWLYGQFSTAFTGYGLNPTAGGSSELLAMLQRSSQSAVRTIMVAGATILTAADAGVILLDASTGSQSITLPAANAGGAGTPLRFTFIRVDASANDVSLFPAGTNLFQPGAIDAAALVANPCRIEKLEKLILFADGVSNWYGSYVAQQRLRIFTAGAVSWTCPPFITTVKPFLWGGGGGGGSCNNAAGAGGGGGGGAFVRGAISVVPGTTYTGNVGAGGTAATGAATGGAGGTTSFAGVMTAGGGGGGIGSGGGGNSGGLGGAPSGGTFNSPGAQGGQGYSIGSVWAGGIGGTAVFGASLSQPNVGAPGNAGNFPGGGGGGGAAVNNSGAGGAGLLQLEY